MSPKIRRAAVAAVLSALALALFLSLGGAAPARAEDPAFLTGGIGYFDVFKDENAATFHAELRTDRLWFITPLTGIFATSEGGVYGYGGFNIDFLIGRRFVVSPGFAVGYYSKGDGKDLGDHLEFKSGAEFAYRLDSRARIGIALYHLSNAGIGDINPGTEVLALTYSQPLGCVFRCGR